MEKHRQKIFENRLLKKTFGPKREEVALKWRRPHKDELRDLYWSPNIMRVTK
jgi:RecA-family ATPase